MIVHLMNPSHVSFGISVITPRWLFVLAAATPREYGDPVIHDETLERIDFSGVKAGDVVGIGIHTGNALRGYEVGRRARELGAFVVFGGIHATLYPEEAHELGGAHAVVKGDGDVIWGQVLADCQNGGPEDYYDAGLLPGSEFIQARWDLLQSDQYMWASVQTVRGCPKHCSFCSVWRTDGQQPRQRTVDHVMEEIVTLRRLGFRFIALADDNFYPVTPADLETARRNGQEERLRVLQAMRDERFELMARMAKLPHNMMFFTQITMEVADDPEFLDAMREARIRGALVGIESVTPEGLKAVYKGFNPTGDSLVEQLATFRKHGVFVLGSFIFGLPTDRPESFDATVELAQETDLTFAQFLTLTPFPGTVDFQKWEKSMVDDPTRIDGHPLTRYWLIPPLKRPKIFSPHPVMTQDEIRQGTLSVWQRFYGLRWVWKRSDCCPTIQSRLAFVLISKLYLQMYANTGITTDSNRQNRSAYWARLIARACRRFFCSAPMPELEVPGLEVEVPCEV